MKFKNDYAVILCGGSGLRLWPLSRKSKPKQFLNIGNKSISLFQKTLSRVSRIFNKKNIYIVTSNNFYFEVLSQLSKEYDEIISNILTEPEVKNTLPAISYAVMEIYKRSKNANIGVFPADHEINKINEFEDSWSEAFSSLNSKNIAIFGIKPNKPIVGYGYIKLGTKLKTKRLYKVSKFIEKPSLAEAQNYIHEGYLWNRGMFAFQIGCFIDNLRKFQPEIYSIFFNSSNFDISSSYKKLPNISIDKGLIEKSLTKIIAGLLTTARAMPIRCFSPADNICGYCFSFSSRLTLSKAARTRRLISCGRIPSIFKGRAMLSKTVRSASK